MKKEGLKSYKNRDGRSSSTAKYSRVFRYNPFYVRWIKPLLGRCIAFAVFVITALPMLLIALLIKIDDPKGPIVFRQPRLGYHGTTFTMLKFRTMKVGAEHSGSGVYSEKGDPRVTRIGRILRAASLDELPQLFNVLKGEMALIGPRAPLTYHPWPLEEYTAEQRKMFNVRPGFSGWAQIHGRKTVEWHERIRLNDWYAEHISFSLDLYIFVQTILQVLQNKDNENIGKTV